MTLYTNIFYLVNRAEAVRREVIRAAFMLYLPAALAWASLYTFLELIDPASFQSISSSDSYIAYSTHE